MTTVQLLLNMLKKFSSVLLSDAGLRCRPCPLPLWLAPGRCDRNATTIFLADADCLSGGRMPGSGCRRQASVRVLLSGNCYAEVSCTQHS